MATTPVMSAAIGQQQFMQLLLTQLRNQDPLSPMDDTQFITQLSQFSMQQGIQDLDTNFSNLLALQELTQGTNLVGRKVTYQAPGASGGLQQGVVSGISVNQGQLQVMVQGQTLPLSSIQSIQ